MLPLVIPKLALSSSKIVVNLEERERAVVTPILKLVFNGRKKGKDGCNKGGKCEFFHHKLCNDSIKNRKCLKDNCKLVHLPKTVRHEVEKDSTSSSSSSPPPPPTCKEKTNPSPPKENTAPLKSIVPTPVESPVFHSGITPSPPDYIADILRSLQNQAAVLASLSNQVLVLSKESQGRLSQSSLPPPHPHSPIVINGVTHFPQLIPA